MATHYWPILDFDTNWKYQKNIETSDKIRGYENK